MRKALKLTSLVLITGLIASCGGGGGGGSATLTTSTTSPTQNSSTTQTSDNTNTTNTDNTKTATVYAQDSALKYGIASIQRADGLGYGYFTAKITSTNGQVSIPIDVNKFKENFLNPESPAKFIRICADGIDDKGNVYLGADDYTEGIELGKELLGDPNNPIYPQDDALCMTISMDDFDPDTESYFVNPYTDVVDFLFNYGGVDADTLKNLVEQIDQDLGIQYKDTAYDGKDAEDYINDLATAFGVQYGKAWEWKAKILKEFLARKPEWNTWKGNTLFRTFIVKPQRVDASSITDGTKETCTYYWWDTNSQSLKTDAMDCYKIDTDIAVGIEASGAENDEGVVLLVNSGKQDSNGNPIYYIAGIDNIAGSYEDIGNALDFANGINPKTEECYDKNAKKDIWLTNIRMVNCELDSNTKEIVCYIKGTVATQDDPDNNENLPECNYDLINATMDGQTVGAKGYIYLSKSKRGALHYNNDPLALLYDDLFEE